MTNPVFKKSTNLFLSFSLLPSSEVSHSIRSTAKIHVSRTTSTSALSSLSPLNSPRHPGSANAPSASAASCLHIESSKRSSRTAFKYGTAARHFVWPRQYASSCLSRAEGEEKAAAIASIAAKDSDEELPDMLDEARCLREKRARKRRARGTLSEVRVLRSTMIVRAVSLGLDSEAREEIAEGAITPIMEEQVLM